MYNKNTIFFGPPGTGKTYKSIARAVAIIENVDEPIVLDEMIANYSQVKSRFDIYIKEGLIVFCTFHQSMGYEDFIEGIKPRFEENENSLLYRIEEGILKKISKDAREQQFIVKFWSGIQRNDTKDQVIEKIVNNYYEYYKNLYNNHLAAFIATEFITKSGIQGTNREQKVHPSRFKEDATTGEQEIVFEQGSSSYIKKSIIKNLLNHYYVTNEYTIDKVKQINITNGGAKRKQKAKTEFENLLGNTTTPTYYYVIFYDLYRILKLGEKNYYIGNRNNYGNDINYVLLIDEINRGNISQIFGETITTIDDVKRIGQLEELEVYLTYSKQYFGVPNNVYIIGTMNTADRSVESLDIALRRRFSFEPLYPDWKILFDTKHNINEGSIVINKGLLLQAINNRISYFLDVDHTIGHSWLMNCNSLTDLKIVFYQNIIPLLQEYFYNDYGKIQHILGSNFVKTQGNPIQMLGENNDIPEFTKYQITDSNSWTINDFANIYEALPNKSLP
jgi:5-methylcytosine-specific restriction protein B